MHGVILVANKNPDKIMNWHKLTSQSWETSFLASSYDNSNLTTAGLHSDGTLGGPLAFDPNESIQRPAPILETKIVLFVHHSTRYDAKYDMEGSYFISFRYSSIL